MPKQKCRENRKKRMKRDKKFLERLAEKRLTNIVHKAKGTSPRYYDVKCVSARTYTKKGRRFFDLKNSRLCSVPNAECNAIYDEILKRSMGITVDLPAEMFKKDE